MKQVLLLISLLFTVGAWGQSTSTATFDFSNPESLNPSYPKSSFETSQGTSIKVSNQTFTSGDISLFFNDEANATGDFLAKHDFTSGTVYTLDMSDNSRMIVKGETGVKILSVTVSKGSTQGGFGLDNGQGGSFSSFGSNYCCQWTADGGNYNSVSFFCSGSGTGSRFYKLTVTYTPKPVDLTLTGSSLTDGSTIDSFSSIQLTFNKQISLVGNGQATVTSADGNTNQDMTASASGYDLTLSVPTAVTGDGNYTINIPSGLVKDNDGYTNSSMTYTFSITTDKTTFNPVSVTPGEGYVGDTFPATFTITFLDEIGSVGSDAQALFCDGSPKIGVVFSISDDGKSIVGKLNGGKELTDLGTYTFTLPEGFVHNNLYNVSEYDRYNKAVTYTWEVTNKKPDTETMIAAKELLKTNGVGYPATGSESRKALEELTTSEEVPTDEELSTAMTNFYKESNVTLPEDGKYYKIYGINADGKKLYLSYNGSAVTLSSQADDAYSFKAEDKSGKIAFSTLDGKYLHVLMNSETYDATSSKNVTDSYTSSVNDLTLNKLVVSGVDDKLTFGKFSVNGCLGTNKVTGNEVSVNALVDYSINVPVSSPEYTDTYFTSSFSSAFVFEDGSKPEEEKVDIDANFTPSTIESTDETMRLSFTHNNNVVLKDGIELTITDEDGNTVSGASATICAVENSTMDFDITVSGITDGTYYIVIPEGAFSFTQDGKQVSSNEVKEKFTLKSEVTPENPDFKHYYSWTKLPEEGGSQTEYPKNYLTQYIVLIDRAQSVGGLYGNPKARVELREYTNNKLMGYGHFEVDSEHTDEINYALKLVWDQEIDMTAIRTTEYTFVIPEGAFGDGNYAKYLENPSNISSSECTVNDSYTKTYSINSEISDGIEGLEVNDDSNSVIFDLQGRRIKKITRAGIYIINGKKVIKR
ncbi:MAG: Ig-like domain-containing protein [Prevotella sp.]|jgi:hypothetical protein